LIAVGALVIEAQRAEFEAQQERRRSLCRLGRVPRIKPSPVTSQDPGAG
jgi:hypothetical protein